MTLRVLTWGSEPIYYVQKSYRKEDGKNATKNIERLGTMHDLVARFGEDDPVVKAKHNQPFHIVPDFSVCKIDGSI